MHQSDIEKSYYLSWDSGQNLENSLHLLPIYNVMEDSHTFDEKLIQL